MKVLEQETEIGKCAICRAIVTNNEKQWHSELSVMYKEKIICGVCLINLNGAAKSALESWDKHKLFDGFEMDAKEITMEKWGVYVDPDTGKIVSKGIREAKA